MDQILNDNDVHFTRFQPTPISECCACFGISRIDYIPPAVLSSPENRNGLYKSFNDGWGFVWMAIQAVLKDGCTPSTIRRVEQHLESPRGLVDLRYDSRKYHHFLSKGGKVEFAIDALINVTRNVAVDGDDGWEYGIFDDQIESLPATHSSRRCF